MWVWTVHSANICKINLMPSGMTAKLYVHNDMTTVPTYMNVVTWCDVMTPNPNVIKRKGLTGWGWEMICWSKDYGGSEMHRNQVLHPESSTVADDDACVCGCKMSWIRLNFDSCLNSHCAVWCRCISSTQNGSRKHLKCASSGITGTVCYSSDILELQFDMLINLNRNGDRQWWEKETSNQPGTCTALLDYITLIKQLF